MINFKADGFIKLKDLLKVCNLTSSGGEAKNIIKNGEVKLNSKICISPGKKLYNNDIVEYGEEIIKINVD
ncbi:MAG: RNA-binding S4 domain-containing protein [Peptoniphilaceae bacterium]|nr:RNA-binding S4 domain-containing protein [Peptoniphilaceae bacterium]MDY3738529.1 RNA-binding S4 domain-containing protein [Peptoniphilaceae bacterium]